MRARLILALCAACFAIVGCADDDSPRGDDPVDVATAYVEAIDARDGDAFCDLVAPYISGTLDLELKNPDSNISGTPSCGEFIGEFIGYIEDCCPPEFIGAEVTNAELGERRGELQAVDLELELELEENDARRKESLRDVVWLAQFDSEWRVAKLSAVAHAASLAFTIGGDSQEDDRLTPPDLDAQLRAYEAEREKSSEDAEERDASYTEPGRPASCDGLSVPDPPGDARDYVQPAPDEPPPPTPYADLREVEVEARDGDFCVRFVAAGEIQGPVEFTFNLREPASGATFLQLFTAEVREDGLARVTSGVDDDQHPISVPAEVGVEDDELTMRLTRDSFKAGKPSPHVTAPPPTERFAFMASVTAPLGERRALHDDLGSGESAVPFGYPSGEACGLDEC